MVAWYKPWQQTTVPVFQRKALGVVDTVLITSVRIHVLSGHPSTCSIGSLRTKFATYVLSTVQSWLDHSPVSSLMIPFHHPDKFFISYHVLQNVLCFQICLFFHDQNQPHDPENLICFCSVCSLSKIYGASTVWQDCSQ